MLDGGRTHVEEFNDCYLVHWDKKSLGVDPIGHLVLDSPSTLVRLLSILADVLYVLACHIIRESNDRMRRLLRKVLILLGLMIAEWKDNEDQIISIMDLIDELISMNKE